MLALRHYLHDISEAYHAATMNNLHGHETLSGDCEFAAVARVILVNENGFLSVIDSKFVFV
jgi:hypothetical protein